MKKKKVHWIPLLSIAFIYFFITVFLVYHQIYDMSGHYLSDTFAHIIFLYRYFYTPDFYIPHPLWHATTYLLAKLFHISIESSAAISSGIFVSFWTGLVYFISEKTLKKDSWIPPLLATVIITVIGPLCIPWYKKIIFLGQGSPNIWHNVTLWAVKPFALLATWYTLKYYTHPQKTEYALIALFAALLSLFAKPSFMIVYLPALFIFTGINRFYRQRQIIWFLCIVTFASILILFYQYSHTFGVTGSSHIIFDPLGVWSLSSQNITISIFLGLAFPILYTFLKPEIINRRTIQLSWLMVFFGIAFYALLAQSGKCYAHGNFGWSYVIAMSLLYLFAILEFFRTFYDLALWKRLILSGVLVLQTATGFYYLLKVLEGQNPLYISIYF